MENQPCGLVLTDKVNNVAMLIQYQEGSIVSRKIINKGPGTVSLFAFDQGQELSAHTAPFDVLLHAVDGEADITVAGTTHRVRQGDIIILPANITHAVSAITQFKMLLTTIRS